MNNRIPGEPGVERTLFFVTYKHCLFSLAHAFVFVIDMFQPNLTRWPVLTRSNWAWPDLARIKLGQESQYGLDHETIEKNEFTGFMSPMSQ